MHVGTFEVAGQPACHPQRVDAQRLGGCKPLAACELERARDPACRLGGIVDRDCELDQGLQRPPFGPRSPSSAAIARASSARPIPRMSVPPRMSNAAAARSASIRRGDRSGARVERSSEPPLSLAEVDAAEPERPHRHAEPERSVRVLGERASRARAAGWPPRGRAAASAPSRSASAVAHPHAGRSTPPPHPPRRAARARRRRSCRAGRTASRRRPRLRRRATSRRVSRAHLRRRRLGGRVGAHDLGGVEIEAAREGGEPPEERLLVLVEQVVAPVQRREQRLLPRRGGAAAATAGGGSGRRGARRSRTG